MVNFLFLNKTFYIFLAKLLHFNKTSYFLLIKPLPLGKNYIFS
jgi:hypothetical protein